MDFKASHELQLGQTERHIRDGRQHIVQQERLIIELRRENRDTTLAQAILATLLASQALHEGHRALLLRELMQHARRSDLIDSARVAIAMSRQLLAEDVRR
jgi:hypothetical protein